MTQEELDQLMNGDIDTNESFHEEEYLDDFLEPLHPSFKDTSSPHSKSHSSSSDVTALLETLREGVLAQELQMHSIVELLHDNERIFKALRLKFPSIVLFKERFDKTEKMLHSLQKNEESFSTLQDNLNDLQDLLTYHQKQHETLHKLLKVMGTLHHSMEHLFPTMPQR